MFSFLLLFSCFLSERSSCEENPPKNKDPGKESKNETNARDHTAQTVQPAKGNQEELDSKDREKILRIKQSEDGKTVDDVKNEIKARDEKEDGQKKREDEVKMEKEGGQVDEKKAEEVGLDLKELDDDNFEHLTQAATGATTGDWLVLL